MAKKSKRYTEAAALIENGKLYSAEEAIELVKKTSFKLLKDLDTDHIKNIIKFFENQNMLHRLNKEYLEYFNKRINNLNK